MHERAHTRRKFLARAVGTLAMGGCCAAIGCRGDRKSKTEAPAKAAAIPESPGGWLVRPPLPQNEPTMRIRVMRVRAPRPPLLIGAEGQWIGLVSSESGDRGVAMQGPIAVTMERDGWSIIDGAGMKPPIAGRASIELSAMPDQRDAQTEASLIVDEGGEAGPRRYGRVLRLVSRHDLEAEQPASRPATAPPARRIDDIVGASTPLPPAPAEIEPGGCACAFDLIADVPMETYLPGVLAGELYRSWHAETFAAQAIAARSYAATEAAVFAGRRHYDVSNTASSQMYVGSVDHPRALEAVQATRGLVMAWDDRLVSGYYSSCCGGAAARAADAIGDNPVNNIPPLHGRSGSDVCTEAPVYQWTNERPVDLLSRQLAAFGASRNMRALASIGRLASIEVIEVNPHGRPTMVRVSDQRQQAAELSAENFRRAANGSIAGASFGKELRSSFMTASVGVAKVSFEGNGFGHGAGLCQYGAEALAKAGTAHLDIVHWYYPEIAIARCWQ